jgi:hypothetical protein
VVEICNANTRTGEQREKFLLCKIERDRRRLDDTVYVAQIWSVNICALQMQVRSWSQRSEASVRDRNGILICDHRVCDVTQRIFKCAQHKIKKRIKSFVSFFCFRHHYVEIVLFGTQ